VPRFPRARCPAAPATCTRRGPSPNLPEAGQGLVEYGLILVVMAVVCVISLLFFGDQLSSLLSLIGSAV
jgi:Flp pilus assembly pilin Flp